MQAACRINKQDIDIAGLGRFQRVKHHGSRIRPFLVGDHITLGPLAPDLQLGGGCGPEGVPCRHHHFVVKQAEIVGQLTDGGGLAHAVHSHHQDHRGMRADTGPDAIVLQHGCDLLLQKRQHILRTFDFFLLCSLPHIFNQLFRGFYAHIGCQQDHLQLFQKILVHFDRHAHQFRNPVGKILARLGQARFQFLKKAHGSTSFPCYLLANIFMETQTH